MSPQLHTEAPPRVPGDSLRGKRPHDYGRGRVCTQPGCTTILRRTHAGPVCDPCQDNDHVAAPRRGAVAARRPHKPEIAGSSPAAATNHSGPPASAHGEAVTTAAPAIRATKEEKMGKESLRDAVLLAFARDPSRCFSPGDVVKSCGVSPSCVYKNLKALVASGEIVKDAPGEYRWPTLVPLGICIEDMKPDPALDSPSGAAPVIPPPEHPAESAPASDPLGNEPRMPVPFAGIDYELVVIGTIVRQIESLTGHETRVRVASYVAARFL